MTILFDIAGHTLSVDNRNSYHVWPMMRTFRGFAVPENGPAASRAPVLSVVVDDSLVFTDARDEVGHFDSAGCNHGVYETADGGYLIEIVDTADRLCATLKTNSDFTTAQVALSECQALRPHGLNSALMMAFAFATARRDTLLMHSSVIVHQGVAYLFLGKSGTGKSTHTRLWRENIPCSSLLNDDNPALRVEDGKVFVYGTPWSGKTPCYRQHRAPVGGIVMLAQAPANAMRRQSVVEALSSMLMSVSNMKWERRVNNGVLDSVKSVMSLVPLYQLDCRPDAEAARLSYKCLVRNG